MLQILYSGKTVATAENNYNFINHFNMPWLFSDVWHGFQGTYYNQIDSPSPFASLYICTNVRYFDRMFLAWESWPLLYLEEVALVSPGAKAFPEERHFQSEFTSFYLRAITTSLDAPDKKSSVSHYKKLCLKQQDIKS